MRVAVSQLLSTARRSGYAIGAFNVYNLEGILAVVAAAEEEASPVILQVHPNSLSHGGVPLLAACQSAVRETAVPAAGHLDHSSREQDIALALNAGVRSIMADGSALSYTDNVAFTRKMKVLTQAAGACIEAELGRLSGAEDGLGVSEREAKMTDPARAAEFVAATGVDCLAVCIGNVHGHYAGEPLLDFARLATIRKLVDAPLVLHGASCLPEHLIRRSIELGVAKFNVNTEVRGAYLAALRASLAGEAELLKVIQAAVAHMKAVVQEKIRLFGSAGKAADFSAKEERVSA
jgi:tagatose 1,6-diphosphate aldolase GatY/KbaY